MRRTLIILAALVLTAGSAGAQFPGDDADIWFLAQADSDEPGMGPGGPPMTDQAEPGRHRKHLEQLRLLKLLELLDLEEDQETAFIVAFRSLRKDLRALDEERSEVVEQLSTGLKEGGLAEAETMRLIDRTLELGEKRHQRMSAFVTEARTLLTPDQLGKLVVFHDRFEYELLERVKAFHGRGGRGPFDRGKGRNDDKGN
jgi:Spy/CpxP family protein refolding chaperone